jgi:hypothetical protein
MVVPSSSGSSRAISEDEETTILEIIASYVIIYVAQYTKMHEFSAASL